MTSPGGGGNVAGDNPPSNLEATRRQVDEVQNIMKENVEKVLERDGKLSQLEDRAERLQEGTEQFHKSSIRIKRKQFWENMKMKIIIGVVVLVIILVFLIWLFS